MYSLELLMMDGKAVRNIPELKKFDTLVHLVGFAIEIIFTRVLGILQSFFCVLLLFEEYCLKCL